MPRPNPKTLMIHARIDPRLKKSAETIFSELGISTTEAIRLFLKQVELHRGLPFPVSVPNEETLAATARASHHHRFRKGPPPREKAGQGPGQDGGHREYASSPEGVTRSLPSSPVNEEIGRGIGTATWNRTGYCFTE